MKKEKTMLTKRTVNASLVCALSFTSLLAACSSNSTGSNTSGKKEEAPVSINMMSDFTIAQPPSADNPVLKEFEKKTNSKLNITWVSAATSTDYVDRLNVVLSSG